ncbi:hypothetical protein J2X65_003554 [Ancylobacter sp. 3268]|uniref:hypothetical protein n=1 Tax=Ancylobacter sp. 3268 TaxID=2817752 RepID=UPI002856B873|nr:hypothetical protein [Ancylobacter sp. 3268]MDR6954186.1 hypothetical protein [Ancylobacter sp. 3268]
MSELLPLGLHLGLAEEAYHADPALGSTSIKGLATKPCKWQYDRLRPRKDVEPEHLVWGRAWHCRVLEGKAAFEQRYAKPPRPEDYPDALNTTDQIKDFLRMHGQKLTGNKPELMARAKEMDDCPAFFDEIFARWSAEHPDHVQLTDRQVQEIEDAVANMERDPTLSSVMTAGSLLDGAAEMSVIWVDERGIRRKCRYDYGIGPTPQRPKSLIVDLKSFTSYKGGSDEEAAIRKVYDEFYDLQTGGYMDGYVAGRAFLSEGQVFGIPPAPGYLESFFNAPGVDWVWIFMRRDNGMIPITLSIDTEDVMFVEARKTVTAALDTYLAYVARFGVDQLWTPPPKAPLRLNHTVMPTYNRGILHEQPNHR